MKKFVEILALSDGGGVALGIPGFVEHGGGRTYYAFIQSGCQLRVTRGDNSPASYAVITVVSGAQSNGMQVSLAYGGMAYADITELARAGIEHFSPSPDEIEDGSTSGSITVELFRENGTSLGFDELNDVRWCDALAVGAVPWSSRYYTAPDKIRALDDSDFSRLQAFTARAFRAVTADDVQIECLEADGSVVCSEVLPNGCQPVCVGIDPDIAMIRIAGQLTRVGWESCRTDKMLVKWWSCEVGGYKSYLLDVVSPLMSDVNRSSFNSGFEYADIATASVGWLARFPLLSMRDWLYCRDILTSSEVQVLDFERAIRAAVVYRRATVKGTPGQWRPQDVKDFNIEIYTDYIETL